MGTSASAEFDTKKSDMSTSDDDDAAELERLVPLPDTTVESIINTQSEVKTPTTWLIMTVDEIAAQIGSIINADRQIRIQKLQDALTQLRFLKPRLAKAADTLRLQSYQDWFNVQIQLLTSKLFAPPDQPTQPAACVRVNLCRVFNEGLLQLQTGDLIWKRTPGNHTNTLERTTLTRPIFPRHLFNAFSWSSSFNADNGRPSLPELKQVKVGNRFLAKSKSTGYMGMVTIQHIRLMKSSWLGDEGEVLVKFDEDPQTTITAKWNSNNFACIIAGETITSQDALKYAPTSFISFDHLVYHTSETICPYQVGTLTAEQTRDLCLWFLGTTTFI